MNKPKILLIYPSVHKEIGKRVTPFWLPPLNLATIAGLTPETFDIIMIDENVEIVNFEHHADLVAVTSLTANIDRAYHICREFRKRGIKVIIGGPHVSVCPEEALEHADSVITGNAEDIWNTVLGDYLSNKLQKKYFSDYKKSQCKFGIPRRNIYKEKSYLSTNSIQTSRGCPFQCSFCSIASRYKGQYHLKPMDQVLSEVESLEDKNVPVFFVDDNIFVNRKRSKEFLRKLIKYKIQWWSQADICIADDPELLSLARESGCIKLVVGFESLSGNSLKNINKNQNKSNSYSAFVQTLHSHGIMVNASFAFGGEGDHPDVFEKTMDFLVENHVMFSTFNILTPLPGTSLFNQMKENNEIVDYDWAHYDMGHPVFKPKHMTMKELKDGYNNICNEFYSLPAISGRIQKLKSEKENYNMNLILGWNLGYKKMLDTFGVFM
ncbi:MAG: B12-binding domain-containing radical SAM protein [Spirochaetaceae bacterium]|nr:B12-binding domain-containing radical SAM protein [Spirochaetaceae bacterium]